MSVSPGASPSTTLASIRNPFLHEVVTDPWDRTEVDVPQINASVFDECRRLIEEVASTHRSTSLLLNGFSGSGKTHVSARICNPMGRESSSFPSAWTLRRRVCGVTSAGI
jgi:hypothetical protein